MVPASESAFGVLWNQLSGHNGSMRRMANLASYLQD